MITKIYTDGSALNNADKNKRSAGCGMFITTFDTEKKKVNEIVLKGEYLENNTNNYAELCAVKNAFRWIIKGIKINDMLPKTVNMFIDSKYVIGILKNGNKYKLNTELINRIKTYEQFIKDNGYIINYDHVKAHTKNTDIDSKYNNIVDKIARLCAEKKKNMYHNFANDEKKE